MKRLYKKIRWTLDSTFWTDKKRLSIQELGMYMKYFEPKQAKPATLTKHDDEEEEPSISYPDKCYLKLL